MFSGSVALPAGTRAQFFGRRGCTEAYPVGCETRPDVSRAIRFFEPRRERLGGRIDCELLTAKTGGRRMTAAVVSTSIQFKSHRTRHVGRLFDGRKTGL